MLVIWAREPEKLNDFLNHLDSNIQFTTETESDDSLGHNAYSKLTHTNLYLNAKSPHHLVNKHSVLSTLGHRVRAFRDYRSLRENQISLWYVKIEWLWHPLCSNTPETEDIHLTSVSCMPFVGPIFKCH